MSIRKLHQPRCGATSAAAQHRLRVAEENRISFADVKHACHRHLMKTDEAYVKEHAYFGRHRNGRTPETLS